MYRKTFPRHEAQDIVRQLVAALLDGEASDAEKNLHVLGLAIWDIFSNNHTVVDERGYDVDIGSWRGSGTTISNVLRDGKTITSSFHTRHLAPELR